MSPIGIQRTVAVLILISPWVFIPGIFKDVVFIVAGVLLFVSTLDLRKRSRVQEKQDDRTEETSHTA
jgi:hypothetical protein